MNGYLEVCANIAIYVAMTILAVAAVVVAVSAVGFVLMGVINLIDEFRRD